MTDDQSKNRISGNTIGDGIALYVMFGGVLTWFGAAGTLIWQTYSYLRTGEWPSLSMSHALEYLGVDLSAINAPSEWIGLAEIVSYLLDGPLYLWLVLGGCAIVWLGTVLENLFEKYF